MADNGQSVSGNETGGAWPTPPGLSPARLCALMRDSIAASGLDLTNMTILTEAASGAYVVTAVVAALANARRVYALARSSEHGSLDEVRDLTMRLASSAGVADRISIVEKVPLDILKDVDLITNTGHLRPITGEIIDNLPTRSVVALMFEAWEFRPQDIDLEACHRRQISVVGVNERHASVDVFSYLGPLCVKLLHDAGLAVYRDRIALVCDNDFADPIACGLTGLGGLVHRFPSVEALYRDCWDVIVVALRPALGPRIGASEAVHIASASAPGTLVAQFWGDLDRDALRGHGLTVWPQLPPRLGHMAILLSAIGPEPIVRLQTGGLRAAEWIFRGGIVEPGGIAQPLGKLEYANEWQAL